MEVKEISQAVIGRLPRYFRYLGELKDEGVERISSQELSGLMKVTASQIRQDFNNFGGFGQQGYGYNVESLYREIGKILGLDKQHNFQEKRPGRFLSVKKTGNRTIIRPICRRAGTVPGREARRGICV